MKLCGFPFYLTFYVADVICPIICRIFTSWCAWFGLEQLCSSHWGTSFVWWIYIRLAQNKHMGLAVQMWYTVHYVKQAGFRYYLKKRKRKKKTLMAERPMHIIQSRK